MKANTLLYHSTLGSCVIKKKKKETHLVWWRLDQEVGSLVAEARVAREVTRGSAAMVSSPRCRGSRLGVLRDARSD